MPNDDPLELMTIQDVADLFKVKVSFLYDQVEDNDMPNFKIGKLLRFRREEVLAWLEARARGSVPQPQQPRSVRPEAWNETTRRGTPRQQAVHVDDDAPRSGPMTVKRSRYGT